MQVGIREFAITTGYSQILELLKVLQDPTNFLIRANIQYRVGVCNMVDNGIDNLLWFNPSNFNEF